LNPTLGGSKSHLWVASQSHCHRNRLSSVSASRLTKPKVTGPILGGAFALGVRSFVCATVPRLVSAYYLRVLDHVLGAMLRVEFTTEGGEITDYAIVLLLALDGLTETIRVYDGAHGHNEMHRYTRSGGKQSGEPFHAGTLGEGMRAAIEEIERGYDEMIEGWKRQ